MVSLPLEQSTASVVELAAFRKRATLAERPFRATAELVSLRQSLDHEASVEIDDLDALVGRFDDSVLRVTSRRVRALLDHEFGRLRVHRNRRHYIVRHRSVEGLIAGLLRAQFHARSIELPSNDRFGERSDHSGIALTWGVGRSGPEAELERLRRRRQKKQQR